MLAPVLAAIVQFYSPALPNSGYVDVLVPTNPIPYASRLKGEVFGNGELLPRVEDMIFTYQLAFERMIVREMGVEARHYAGKPLDVEPSTIPVAGRHDIAFFGYRGSQVSSGADATFVPTQHVPADMLGYAMCFASNQTFFAVSDSPSVTSLIPSSPFLLDEGYAGNGADFVLERMAGSCFDPSLWLQLTNRVNGLFYKRDDLYALCELGDAMSKYCFLGNIQHVTNAEETVSQDYTSSWWRSGTGPDSGWQYTNSTHTTHTTNALGTMAYVATADKSRKVYWSADNFGNPDQKQGAGYDIWIDEYVECPKTIYAVLCGDKAYYWDYQREGTSSRVRQKSLHAYAVFYATGEATGRTSVNASLDTTLVDEELECWVVCPLGAGTPTPIPHVDIGDGYTNRWCEIRYAFTPPDLSAVAAQACQFFGWGGLPSQGFPNLPAASDWVPNGASGYIAQSYLDYVVNLSLEDFVGIVEYDFVATLKVKQGGESQEGANDNP